MRVAADRGAFSRAWWSLAGRVWLTIFVVVFLMAALGALAISRLSILESSVNSVLLRNYRSIEAAHGMQDAIGGLRSGDLGVERAEADFRRWLEVERSNITEPGEGGLAAALGDEGGRFFDAAKRAGGGRRSDRDVRLEKLLHELIELNEHAMFSADRRTVNVARRLRRDELVIALLAVLVLAGSGYLIARPLVLGPLRDLIETLQHIGNERSLRSMPTPRTAELATLAREFNAMVGRLQRDFQSRLDELERERSKTGAILESVEDGLLVLDQSGAIVHVNEVARAILALGADQPAEGSTLDALAEHNRHVVSLLAEMKREPGVDEASAEIRVFIRGRDHIYLTRTIQWIGPAGERLGTIVLLQDVTFIRDQERARSNLIATLSHELKTPLTSLAIGVDLLTESHRDGAGAKGAEIVETVRDDIARLRSIADSLMDASRKSAARIGVERRPIMLERIVRDICRPLMLQAEEKRIVIELAPQAAQPIPVWGDPIKLPWVISNLVGNALRYTPPGGRITVALEREGRVARVRVSDTGSGIDPDVLPRIFEPYAQFPDGGTDMGSAGLGLYIAKEIVEAHNGRIFVRSERGRGSTFTVEIPVREEAAGG